MQVRTEPGGAKEEQRDTAPRQWRARPGLVQERRGNNQYETIRTEQLFGRGSILNRARLGQKKGSCGETYIRIRVES